VTIVETVLCFTIDKHATACKHKFPMCASEGLTQPSNMNALQDFLWLRKHWLLTSQRKEIKEYWLLTTQKRKPNLSLYTFI